MFAVIGTAYGDGDGSSTFNLPNAINRYIGYNGRGYLDENLPNIIGQVSKITRNFYEYPTSSGCLSFTGSESALMGNNAVAPISGKLEFNASSSNNKYTSINEVRPLTLRVNCIIKY